MIKARIVKTFPEKRFAFANPGPGKKDIYLHYERGQGDTPDELPPRDPKIGDIVWLEYTIGELGPRATRWGFFVKDSEGGKNRRHYGSISEGGIES